MSEPAALFISACWGAWLLYWVLTAFSTKRTVERGSFFGYRLVTGAGVLVVVIAGRLLHDSSATQLWRSSLPVALLSDLIVLAGAAVMVWARLTLGRNWSAEVSFKQDHELIESGPYAHVRHPIYSGLLLMCLGTAIFYGRALGFGLLLRFGRRPVVEGARGGADDEPAFSRCLRRLQLPRPRDRPARAVSPARPVVARTGPRR